HSTSLESCVPASLTVRAKPPPRVLYVVSEDWYFLAHRLPTARAARDAGYEVHVATRVVEGADAIGAEDFKLHAIPFRRGRVAIFPPMNAVLPLPPPHHKIPPAVAHHVALQAIVFGSLASLGRSIPIVNAFTGLGFIFSSDSARARLLRPVITFLLS